MQSVWISRHDYERRIRLVRLASLPIRLIIQVCVAPFSSCRDPDTVGRHSIFRNILGRQRTIYWLQYLQAYDEANMGCRETRRCYSLWKCANKIENLRPQRI